MIADLRERQKSLKEEAASAFRLQMRKLGPHFPFAEEIELATSGFTELSDEDTDQNEELLEKRSLLEELAFDFTEIRFDGMAQVVWKGKDAFIGNNDHSELLATKRGELVYGWVEDGKKYYRILSNVNDKYVSNDFMDHFILSTNSLEQTSSRWDRARELV